MLYSLVLTNGGDFFITHHTLQGGLYLTLTLQRAVIGASQSVMVPATGSKLETGKLVSIDPLSAIDVVIAGALDEETLRGIEGEGVRVVQAYRVQKEE